MTTDTTKLVASFKAFRMTIGCMPENILDALNYCRELGLLPQVCGDQDGRILFRILVPDVPEPEKKYGNSEKAFMKVHAVQFHGTLYNCVRTKMVAPLPTDVVC